MYFRYFYLLYLLLGPSDNDVDLDDPEIVLEKTFEIPFHSTIMLKPPIMKPIITKKDIMPITK